MSAQPQIEKQDLFQAGENGYAAYRIPGIVVTAKGTILVYAEARRNNRADWGAIDIVMRRSRDEGRTWSGAKSIARVEGPKQKNPAAVAKGLRREDGFTYNNPVAIAARDGSVHFLFCLEYMRAFYMRSDDDGVTFSKPVEITAAFDGFRPVYEWKVLATGPGHGIELQSGCLVVPVWLSTGTGSNAHRPSVASVIYSEDRGRSWQSGEIAFPNTDEFVNPSETAVAQLPDGRVMLNARSESKEHLRLIALSRDGTTGWSTPHFDPELIEPVCMASLLSLEYPGGNALLFSNPDHSSERRNLTLRLSRDGGKTWKARLTIDPEPSAYSDLAALPGGTILCFYERGATWLTLARIPADRVTAAHPKD